MQSHLCVAEVEHQMLPLVPNIIILEPEEDPEPVEEVIGRLPRHKGGTPEVSDGS